MVRINHIAIRTTDPDKTAAFYKEVFGLEEVGLARSGYYLSDGYINLAILKANEEAVGASPRDAAGYSGIDHLGFMVDDLEEIKERLEAAGAQATNQRIDMIHPTDSNAQAYYELKYRGPDDQVIDITESGWIGT